MIAFDVPLLAEMVLLLAITRRRSVAEVIFDMLLGALLVSLAVFWIVKEESDSTMVRIIATIIGAILGAILGFFGIGRRFSY